MSARKKSWPDPKPSRLSNKDVIDDDSLTSSSKNIKIAGESNISTNGTTRSGTQRQKAEPKASSLVYACLTKSKPDSKPEFPSNEDIDNGDSATVGGRHITITSGRKLDIDGKTQTMTNRKSYKTVIPRENYSHSWTITLNGCEYLGVATVRKKTQCPNDSGRLEQMEIIYSQNTQGIWWWDIDERGRILEKERDTTNLKKILDKMRQYGIGAWIMQDTWWDGYKFYEEVRGFHIFNHNYEIGGRGDEHLWKGVGIILSKKFYQVWKDAGLLPPIMMDTKGKYVV